MSKKTLYLLGILLTILIGTYFYWKICCGGALAGDVDHDEAVDTNPRTQVDANTSTAKATIHPFSLSDANGDFSFSSNDNFNFDASGFSILKPISDNLSSGIDELQLYLGGNEGKSLDVTGWYTADENNTSAFPNLGMARANAVKNYLITKGIPSSRMNLFGMMKDDLVPDGTIYRGPVNFGIATATDDTAANEQAEMDALKAKIQADPLVLHFGNAQTSINLSPEQRQKIADISRYLDKVSGSKAIITGHTDNTGSRQGNITISKKRADFARGYFVQNGISESQMDTAGKGPDEPVGSNDTEEGRAQNRRTVVTVN